MGFEHVDDEHDDFSDALLLYSSPPPPPSLPMTSPTMSAVKESILQATFAEQTAMEMKEIMAWYQYKDSSVATPNPGATGTRSSGGGNNDDGSNDNFESVMTPQSHFFVRNSLVDEDDGDDDDGEFVEWNNTDTNGVATIMSFPGSDRRSRSGANQSDAGSHSVSLGDESDSASMDDPHHAALIQTAVTPTRPVFQLPAEVRGNLEARTQQREVDRLCNITQEMEDIAKALPQHDGSDDSSLDLSLSSLLSIPFPLQLSPYPSNNGTGIKRTPVKELDNVRGAPNISVSPLSVSSSQSDQVRNRISIRSRWYNNFQHYLLRRKTDAVTAAVKRKPSKAKMILNKTKSNIVVFVRTTVQYSISFILFMLKLYVWGFIHSLALFYLMVDIILSEFAFEIALVGIFLVVRKQM